MKEAEEEARADNGDGCAGCGCLWIITLAAALIAWGMWLNWGQR